jgi:hypothetical protein
MNVTRLPFMFLGQINELLVVHYHKVLVYEALHYLYFK